MKKKMMLAILAVISILSSVSVIAPTGSQRFIVPTASETISSILNFSAEVNGSAYSKGTSPLNNITNVTWGITPVGGSETIVCVNGSNPDNWTGDEWRCSVDTRSFFFDSASYTVTVHVYNNTEDEINTSTVTGVLSDNTDPISTISSPADNADLTQGFTVTVTCTNASSATLRLDTTDYTMSVTGDPGSESCSYTFDSGAPPQKEYNGVYVISSDQNSDATQSSSISFGVDGTSSVSRVKAGGAVSYLGSQGKKVQGTDTPGQLSITSDFSQLFRVDGLNIALAVSALTLLAAPAIGLGMLTPFRIPGLIIIAIVWLMRLL